MNERCELKRYANNLSCILNMGSVVTVNERPMESNEQGFSGATLIRLDVVFNDGQQGSFICKKADLKERVADALAGIHGNNMNRGKEMPYIIDFGYARYAPFYIDLVDYFSFENAALYHKALT